MYHHRDAPPWLHRLFRTGPAIGLAYLACWLTLQAAEQPYWMLPFGLRFGALLLTPLRYWGWLLGAEFVALVITEAGFSSQPASAGALTIGIVDLLIGALGVLLIRGMHVRPSLRVPEDATRLLLSAMLLIVAMSSLHATIIAITHHGAFFSSMLYALGLGVLGHYLGILLIVPLMIMLIRSTAAEQSPGRAGDRWAFGHAAVDGHSAGTVPAR